MAVVIETTIGDFTVDLFVESRPQACKNFLKLCKMKYYNFCLFHSVQPNFLAQTGDPSGIGSGGESVYGLLYGDDARYFEAETMPKLKHNKPGLLSMVNCGNNMLGSQFFITLGEDVVSLDGTHCVFGEITEGADVVLKLNEVICDNLHRPYKDIRITHTIILEDPFEDPSGLVAPDMSPEATQERLANGRIAADEEIDETAGMTAAQVEEMKQQREAKARATILEIVGDLPDAEMAPPENVLFVCKLNPVTTDDDLEIIFSRFGKVKSCEVIRDKTTGDSLQYAFVEFEDQKSCEEAYFKMDNVLIDDRRIHVDFSQSVAKMQWKGKGRGVIYHDNKDQPKDVRSSSHRDREDSKSRRREKDYDEKERRRDRGRDRDDDRQVRERGRARDAEDRHRKKDERDRSKTDWRKRDSKHRKDDYRDDEKRYDSKRKDFESSRRKDDDSKRVSSSTSISRRDDRRTEDRRDDKRSEDRKRDKESRDVTIRNNSKLGDLERNAVTEKQNVRASVEKIEIKEKARDSKFNSPVINISKEDNSNEKLSNDSKDLPNVSGDIEISPEKTATNNISLGKAKMNHLEKISRKEEKIPADEVISKEFENGDTGDDKFSQNSESRMDDLKKSEIKKKILKRKRKVSESRKRKKRRHSSSSESSSESSDSSDSSSSSDSSDHRHGKKKKLIIAKRYYRGGKLVKEIKKKKRSKDTTDSGSLSEESSDTDSKRKHKSKKHKKNINIVKHPKRRNGHSSDDSQSGSSTSDDSDFKDKKKKRKMAEKRLKKKYKNSSSKKKRQRKEATTSSSDSEGSVQNSISSKSSKKLKKSKSLKHNNSSLETNSTK